MNGKVYLVGAGPGDPELLTLKALRLLRTADVVLHDDLVTPEILQLISPLAQVQNVGKRAGSKNVSQEEINFLMIAHATTGLKVIRLKSGDPLIFGRAGEEIEALRGSSIEYEIVPGVTSVLGAAAAAGIPLTHRQISSTLILATGHQAPGKHRDQDGDQDRGVHKNKNKDKDKEKGDWSKFGAAGSTLILYMPGQDYARLKAKLKAVGFAVDTPCAIISKATTPAQRIHRTTLAGLHLTPTLAAPTLLVIGEVVALADRSLVASPGISTFPSQESFTSPESLA